MTQSAVAQYLPDGFVYLGEAVPGIRMDLRYPTSDNFIGAPIDGYEAPRAILSAPAARALARVQRELTAFGLGLMVFDAYRPQRAVDHFLRWARDSDDVRMKARFYPNVAKENLLTDGFIAARSGHSRGSTVDLTLVAPGQGGEALDMGSPFDYFDPLARPDAAGISPAQRAHRLLLRALMTRHGFVPLAQEWWHFTLDGEPWPDTYFDFPVR